MLRKEITEYGVATGEFLRGLTFERKVWKQVSLEWTHDHCKICDAQIREHPLNGDYSEGYVAYTAAEPSLPMSYEGWKFIPAPLDQNRSAHWICPDCFNQFRERFDWTSICPRSLLDF